MNLDGTLEMLPPRASAWNCGRRSARNSGSNSCSEELKTPPPGVPAGSGNYCNVAAVEEGEPEGAGQGCQEVSVH